jgi:hypothetical protein
MIADFIQKRQLKNFCRMTYDLVDLVDLVDFFNAFVQRNFARLVTRPRYLCVDPDGEVEWNGVEWSRMEKLFGNSPQDVWYNWEI